MEKLFSGSCSLFFLVFLVSAQLCPMNMNETVQPVKTALSMLLLADKIKLHEYEKVYPQVESALSRIGSTPVVTSSQQLLSTYEELLNIAAQVREGTCTCGDEGWMYVGQGEQVKKLETDNKNFLLKQSELARTFERSMDGVIQYWGDFVNNAPSPKDDVRALVRLGSAYKMYVVYNTLDALFVSNVCDFTKHEDLYGRIVQHPFVVRDLISPEGATDWNLCVTYLQVLDEVRGFVPLSKESKQVIAKKFEKFVCKETKDFSKEEREENKKRLAELASSVVEMLQKRLLQAPKTYAQALVRVSGPYTSRCSGSWRFDKRVQFAALLNLALKLHALLGSKKNELKVAILSNVVSGECKKSQTTPQSPQSESIKIPKRLEIKDLSGTLDFLKKPSEDDLSKDTKSKQEVSRLPKSQDNESNKATGNHSRSNSDGSALSDKSGDKFGEDVFDFDPPEEEVDKTVNKKPEQRDTKPDQKK
jgi:hypothetical protein